MKIKAWLNAFRLRTLPLALSSVLMGIVVAYIFGFVDIEISIFSIITTTLLQILSNLANDYGDGIRGTDNENRLGPMRTLQSGKISPHEMRNAIILFSILSFLSGLYLLFLSHIDLFQIAIFLVLGLTAIIAAITYTIGKKAYGYKGLGDIFVFLFFGLLAVLGTSYLISGEFNIYALFPAASMGLFSTAVLNLNNLRDIENDHFMGKKTIAVRLGVQKTKLYHTVLINLAFILLFLFVTLMELNWYIYLSFLVYVLFLIDLLAIDRLQNLKKLDPFLKKTAIKTFVFVFIFILLVII